MTEVDAEYIADQGDREGKMRVWDAFNKCYCLTGRAKLPGIVQYLRDMIASEIKFIIYGHHIEVLDAIETEIKKLK